MVKQKDPKFLGSFKCPKCGEIAAVYMKKKVITEPVKGEYEIEFEFR